MSKKKNYTAAFKVKVIKAIEANNGNVSAIAQELTFPCKYFQTGSIKLNQQTFFGTNITVYIDTDTLNGF